ncbi:MAG: hypothetical protein ACD_79C01246G0002 [uncultured bacterium]|nr:MAG: hypothetical protein ACD_79C01246G0002 [uncultured bacterium]
MSQDSFKEISNQSWFSRIGNAFKGILVGFIVFIAAFPLLFWNEGRAVKTYKTLKEGSSIVVSVPCEQVNSINEGKLIHLTGLATTEETVSDTIFGITLKTLKLKRNVEMYQWDEDEDSKTKKNAGGSTTTETTYSYKKIWSSKTIDSGNFKNPQGHENPSKPPPYETSQFSANYITVGAFTLSDSLKDKINKYENVILNSSYEIPAELKEKARISNNSLYIGKDPLAPQIGDIRVSFQKTDSTDISLVAKQVTNTFAPYITTTGGSIELLETGNISAEKMFANAQASNVMWTWILRLAGFFLMILGLNMILKPLSVIADILPVFGNIVNAGTGFISFLLASVLSLITISTAWIVYRPMLGILFLAISLALAFIIKGKLKSRT